MKIGNRLTVGPLEPSSGGVIFANGESRADNDADLFIVQGDRDGRNPWD